MSPNRKKYILGSTYRCQLYFEGKPVVILPHAFHRCRLRNIAFPDQVISVIQTGKMIRFAKNGIKFVKRSRYGSILCIGEDIGDLIIIKTIERGNR